MSESIWIKHDGGGRPERLQPGQSVCYKLRGGRQGIDSADDLHWDHIDSSTDIVEFFPVGMRPLEPAGPTGVEKQLCDLIAARQRLGIRKYGTTLADNPAALVERLQHMLEELLDGAAYAMWAINHIKQNVDDGK